VTSFPALESSVVVPFTLVSLALLVVATTWVMVIRRLREAESGIVGRWIALGFASIMIAAGSLLIGSPVSANDPSAQCGATAADAASLPPDQTADVNGDSCRTQGLQQLQTAYLALGLGVALSVGTLAFTKREPL